MLPVHGEYRHLMANARLAQDTGIAPDIETTLTDEQTANFYFLGTDGDPQLTRALSEVQSAEK